MIKNCNLLIVSIFSFFIISCGNPGSKIDPTTYMEYKNRGDEITNLAQATLLSNVGQAIQTGGTKYAVEFCNLRASSIVDSLNTINSCTISRITEKNRNPNSFVGNNTEKNIIQLMAKGVVNDTLLQTKNRLTYFKPIKIALPACLKCHGNPDTDIDAETLQKINQLYPADLATGYYLNDFRGMWKFEVDLE